MNHNAGLIRLIQSMMTKKNEIALVSGGRRIKTNGKNVAGFSLIEVVISMVIMLVVMGAVYEVLRIALIQRNAITTRIDAVKSARIALNYIRRDAVNAGLSYHNIGGKTQIGFVNGVVGITAATDPDRDLLTGIICGDNVLTNTLNASVRTDAIGFVTRDLMFNGGNPISITGTTASGSDVIVSTPTRTAGVTNPYDLYLMEVNDNSQAVGLVSRVVGLVTQVSNLNSFKLGFGSAVDPLNVNQSATATGNSKSLLAGANITGTLKKINLVAYSVRSDGTLLRKTYGNNTGAAIDKQIETHELIYNVQDFQVSYLLDDGTNSTDPTLGNNGSDNQQKMNKVIQMEISITVLPAAIGFQVKPVPVTIKEVISARNLRYTVN